MAASHSRNGSESRRSSMLEEEEGVLGTALTTRQLEAFSRKVTTTASHLMGDPSGSAHYSNAMSSIHQSMRRPGIQRGVFSITRTSPSELVRAKLSTTEISHRTLTYLSDELLANIPEDENNYSLFQGFQASIPEHEHRKSHRRRSSKGQKLINEGLEAGERLKTAKGIKRERDRLSHRLEMMGIRKNMCSTEIYEIDNRIANLTNMRKIVLERLADIEAEEADAEQELAEVEAKLEDVDVETESNEDLEGASTPTVSYSEDNPEDQAMDASFMSESIYGKLPSAPPKNKRHRPSRRKSMPVLHEHLEPGTSIKTLPAHNDAITALDFDIPFGTLVTAALDDTVRVWDLSTGRCTGFLEGHTASVRCLQVEDNIVATGSMDASIRLWDLSRTKLEPPENRDVQSQDGKGEDDGLDYGNDDEDNPPPPPPLANSMEDCPLFALEAHVDEITALHMRGDTLVSGSSDKTLRQWDLVKGRCVQTLDVLWAAAQASSTIGGTDAQWRPSGRSHDASADFVGALQCFDAALACGTADGMVRLWDLRSGQVHRSLVGHTGPITCLQFDQTHLVTGSADRSIRIWDLRTGGIFDAYAYNNAVTDMMFDSRRIVAAAGENVVKVYDKAESRQWDCGPGESHSAVERVRVQDGYLVEGSRDGSIGVWAC